MIVACGSHAVSSSYAESAVASSTVILTLEKKRPVRSLPPSKPLTGPAPPRRSVCAPGTMSLHSIADQPGQGELTMSFTSWLRNLRPALAPSRAERNPRRQRPGRGRAAPPLLLQQLEDRSRPSCLVSLAPSPAGPPLVGEPITPTPPAAACGAAPP